MIIFSEILKYTAISNISHATVFLSYDSNIRILEQENKLKNKYCIVSSICLGCFAFSALVTIISSFLENAATTFLPQNKICYSLYRKDHKNKGFEDDIKQYCNLLHHCIALHYPSHNLSVKVGTGV